jgi:hypothetical protein
MNNLFLILVTVCKAVEPQDGMYVWGPSVLSEEDALNLRVDSQLDFSFIRVGYAEKEVFIDLLRRGKTWKPKVQFCSTMLPAVIRDFACLIGLDMAKDVDRMSVVNAAKPRRKDSE